MSYADMEVALDFWGGLAYRGCCFNIAGRALWTLLRLAAQICNLLPGEAGQGGATNA